jgi:non-ribosomal peptide synthase protein (TIGR01720 family)
VSFNYLGQLDQVLRPVSGLRLAREEKGRDRSPRAERACILQVGASVGEGRLQVRFTYSSRLHDRASILELGSLYRRELRALIDHCRAKAAELAAVGFPLSRLDAAQLGRVAAALDSLDLDEAE